jgi:hypothetical protein
MDQVLFICTKNQQNNCMTPRIKAHRSRASHLSSFLVAVLALVLSVTLALLSVFIQRQGPELVQYGNLCGPTGNDPCTRPVLKGGFPFAYLFDNPGVSVENQLAFIEDQMSLGALILDIAVYFTVIMVAVLVVSRHR